MRTSSVTMATVVNIGLGISMEKYFIFEYLCISGTVKTVLTVSPLRRLNILGRIAVLHTRPIVTDQVARSVGLLVGVRLSQLQKWVNRSRCCLDPGNHVLDGGPDAHMGRDNFEGKGASPCKV